MRENYNRRITVAKHALAYCCCLFMLCVLPLYFEDGYFNMLQAKWHVFIWGAMIFIVAAVVILVAAGEKPSVRISWYGFTFTAFGIISVISSVLSKNPWDALTGRNGWLIGGFSIVALLIVFRMLSSWMGCDQNMWIVICFANCVIFIVGILYSFGIDMFQMHKDILPGFESLYFSTIGHVNWLSGYVCLLFPLFLILYLYGDDIRKYAYLLLLVLALITIVLRASDGVYIGLGFGSLFAIPYILENKERRRRLGGLFIIYGICSIIMRLIPALHNTELEGLKNLLTSYQLSVALIVLAVIGFLMDFFISAGNEKYTRFLIIAVELILVSIIILCLVHTFTNFSDSWGTGRGRIWKVSLRTFRGFSFKSKLVGIGPEMLASFYVGLFSDMPLLVAHSEPIQILLTLGLLGLICWGALWGGIFWMYFRRKLWRKNSLAFFLPLVSYFGQSFFNSAMITNLAVLCVIAAIFFNIEGKEQYEI